MAAVWYTQGDSQPGVLLTIIDAKNCKPFDLDDPSITVEVAIRRCATGVTVMTIPCTIMPAFGVGAAYFDFVPYGGVPFAPGSYEGQVRVYFGTEQYTIPEYIHIMVRERF